jgi:hypothetical protein
VHPPSQAKTQRINNMLPDNIESTISLVSLTCFSSEIQVQGGHGGHQQGAEFIQLKHPVPIYTDLGEV